MEPTLYGELAIIGFNGPNGSCHRDPRRQTKIALFRRPVANGVCPGSVQHIVGPYDSVDSMGHRTHSVSYTLSRHETVVVEYVADPKTDMFQVGRSTNGHIDFVVSEPRSQSHRHSSPLSGPKSPPVATSSATPADGPPVQDPHATSDPHPATRGCAGSSHPESAVSRFACRIHVERDPPHTARIYAAGFDASNKIVLGELAVKWKCDGYMDGLTTNGVMILRTDYEQLFTTGTANTENNITMLQSRWREVSICGSVYQMREKRCVPKQENRTNEDNVLRDMTLIDLCGVTLLWRSAAGLRNTMDAEKLKRMIDCFNDARFQCPVMYHTLRLSYPEPPPTPPAAASSKPVDRTQPIDHLTADSSSSSEARSQPWVYLNCGHVHGWHTWLAEHDQHTSAETPIVRTCALCLQSSRFVPLRMGLESAFYVDRTLATYCFNPCGHMASEKTIRYWCTIPLPNTVNFEFRARCPFCLTPVERKPVLLRFSGDVDADYLAQSLQTILEPAAADTSNEHVVSAS